MSIYIFLKSAKAGVKEQEIAGIRVRVKVPLLLVKTHLVSLSLQAGRTL